ncbi:NADH:ubiquinone reductase (Na(+)-transporting) subunit F [Paracoccus seriniphilus]|uniref:Na(+)-translocating NADH-quinone reductase subunit F n=1 Tax=Paracoccus seriniphilus TaxID=184748 RepID=A0A239PUH8_9RHOB|nr:NADH:ubiquinone reductase (Na(+)-transporting) subunit F [Paracoccus seriniphilus]WCR15353.1 NADH:ubiquinone reductase (Na(+)-transporting) subunit F [Paracoccus seriniphilus]SNT73830.1 Na+-transporting NADH:ubiquinone oxidoreductase subunit F [Paracoccus seriniphilus]
MTEIVLGAGIVILLIVLLTLALLATRQRLIPPEAVRVTVNGRQQIAASRGDRLLGVLHGADIGIPAACGGSGTCGLCRVEVRGEGAGVAQATEKGILSAAERKAHIRLACQTTLRGSCEVTVPDALLGATGFTCRVISNRQLAPLIRELVLELPAEQPFDFRAGSFLQLTAPPYELDFSHIRVEDRFRDIWELADWPQMRSVSAEPVTRAYSIANRPEDVGRVVFNIRLAVPPAGQEHDLPPGVVSSWLFSRQPGDRIEASGPFGDFHVQSTEREMIFIGGGVGMAPLRAMIHEQIGAGTNRRMRFFYGARAAADLFYVDEFDAIMKAHPNFTWTPALSDPAPGDRWKGATGFIHDTVRAALSSHPAPEDCEYYLCGPPVMISAVLHTLAQLGVEPHSIYNDDFGG